jgi:hypothetical protein
MSRDLRPLASNAALVPAKRIRSMRLYHQSTDDVDEFLGQS